MRSARTVGTDLWREVIEKLDEGVIVFNQRGIVIYANDEAARLLGYQPRDVLELDKEDFVSLCDRDRLDGQRFERAFIEGKLPEDHRQSYELVIEANRLRVTPIFMPLEHGEVTVLLLREAIHWRTDLIAQTVMIETYKPLAFALDYSTTLLDRLKSEDAHPYELNDLARIIHDGLTRILNQIEALVRLYATDPRHEDRPEIGPASLGEVLRGAARELNEAAGGRPLPLRIELPGDLLRVSTSPPHLQAALVLLLDQFMSRLGPGGSLVITARNRARYVQIEVKADAPKASLPSYLFDALPLAAAEQSIKQCGGRVWVENQGKNIAMLYLTLPAWDANPTT